MPSFLMSKPDRNRGSTRRKHWARTLEACLLYTSTAEYGDYYAGPQVITDEARAAMRQVLARIQDGSFAREFMEDSANGQKWLLEQRAEHAEAPIEQVGEGIRSMFSFARR